VGEQKRKVDAHGARGGQRAARDAADVVVKAEEEAGPQARLKTRGGWHLRP